MVLISSASVMSRHRGSSGRSCMMARLASPTDRSILSFSSFSQSFVGLKVWNLKYTSLTKNGVWSGVTETRKKQFYLENKVEFLSWLSVISWVEHRIAEECSTQTRTKRTSVWKDYSVLMKKNMQHAYLKGMPLFKIKEQNHAHVPKNQKGLMKMTLVVFGDTLFFSLKDWHFTFNNINI